MGGAGVGGAVVGGAGGAGGVGGGVGCEQPGTVDYVIRKRGNASITLDGLCNEVAWIVAPKIPFTMADFNDSNNVSQCALLWDDSNPTKVWGCCTFGDTQLEAIQTDKDAMNIWNDDAIEFVLDANTDDNKDAQTLKFFINARGTTYDTNFPGDVTNTSHDAKLQSSTMVNGTINNVAPDIGWSVEWNVELPFAAQDELVTKCEFALDDRDGGTRYKTIMFGETINDPTVWGTCKYSCLPAVP